MNESTEALQFENNLNKTYETSLGNEYKVECIARESGNTEDLFAVFKKVGGETAWIKKTSDFRSADDFDGEFNEGEMETSEEVSVGQRYQHFKTKDFYIIRAIAYSRSNPKERFVIYEGQYNSPEFGDHPIWVREFGDFTGMKIFDDGRAPVKRFDLIN
ncbi:MAG: DUF1653 domain-containing protein [archaeon]